MTRPLPAPSGGPSLPVTAVAQRLGVSAPTLRSWERRYGLGASERSQGGHRRYSTADVARLDEMRRLLLDGVAPADAARQALRGPVPPPRPEHGDPGGGSADLAGDTGRLRHAGTGGRVLPLPETAAGARGLARAAMVLDGASIATLLADSLAGYGVQPTWEELLRPVLVAAGERWARTGEGVEVEHLLAGCAAAALRPLQRHGTGRRTALLACAPGEEHSLPLDVLAAALGEIGVTVRSLGAALPAEALLTAIRRTGPRVVVLWAQRQVTADRGLLAAVAARAPRALVIAAGAGWTGLEVAPQASAADSLHEAVELVSGAVS